MTDASTAVVQEYKPLTQTESREADWKTFHNFFETYTEQDLYWLDQYVGWLILLTVVPTEEKGETKLNWRLDNMTFRYSDDYTTLHPASRFLAEDLGKVSVKCTRISWIHDGIDEDLPAWFHLLELCLEQNREGKPNEVLGENTYSFRELLVGLNSMFSYIEDNNDPSEFRIQLSRIRRNAKLLSTFCGQWLA